MFDDHGSLGLAAGLGWAFSQQRYDGYVQAFLAQGYTLPQARAMANDALGITPPNYVRRSWVWLAAAVVCGLLAVTGASAAPVAGTAFIVGVAAVCFWRSSINRRRSLRVR